MSRVLIPSLLVLMACAVAPPAWAQPTPWDLFEDTQSASVCGVVNAANAELVVLSATGQLVIVSGTDIVLEDTFVDLNGDVFFGDEPAGFLAFAEDGDGLRSLWWLSGTGRVVHIDGLTFTPSESDAFPEEFVDVPCDPCDFWDDPRDCTPAPRINVCGVSTGMIFPLVLLGLTGMHFWNRRFGF